MCTNLCKMPSQLFIKDTLGMPVNMVPRKMTTEIQMMDATTSMGANNIATSSSTNASPTMAPAEKTEIFFGIDFKRNYILSGLQDELYNVYSGTKTSKELWRALERKYKMEDAGIKKFLVARFLDFKIIDRKSVVYQVQELQVIIHDLLAEEDNKAAERRSKGNSTMSGAHIVEDGQNNSKKRKKVERGSNQPKKKFKEKCFNCGKIGHKSIDCRAPKKGKKKDQENMIESNQEYDDLCAMFTERNLVGNPREWWMDSGATRHVCANKELFSSFAPAQAEEMLYMANSAITKVEGTGKICLKMTSGKADGTIDKYKAKLVIKGFKQKEGLDYFDTYSPVTRITSIRMLISLAAVYDLQIHQVDTKTPFLNRDLEEEIYMEQPEGFVVLGKENKSKFDMKDLGVTDVILDITIHQTPQGLALSQSHYIEKVLDKFKYMEFGIAKTPLDVSFTLRKNKDFDDMSCEMIFGQDPPPPNTDPAFMQPCYKLCKLNNKHKMDCNSQRKKKDHLDIS
ncbi:hypothetical protein FXO38_18819 [Capsicum annuum]|nr:hypothetical protein FXO38_18819 [Capsicum annuum]